MKLPQKLGFLGTGNMASAMISGLNACTSIQPQILAFDTDPERLQKAVTKWGVTGENSPEALARNSDLIVLAIKPQQLKNLSPEFLAACRGRMILSILAGTPLSKLAATFPGAAAIIRCMPNTPAQVGKGVSAYCSRDPLEPALADYIALLIGAFGSAYPLDEKHFDAFTGLVGSGPAFVMAFLEALENAGKQLKLPENMIAPMVAAMVEGSLSLVLQSGEAPGELRKKVTSPGGTTQAGLEVLQFSTGALNELMLSTVRAAAERSRELSQN